MNNALKNLAVPLNILGMLALYLVLDVLKDWLGQLLWQQFNISNTLITSLPILILGLGGLYLFSRWREQHMNLGNIEETIQNVKIDGALLSIVLALSLWCSGSTGKLSLDQVISLLAILMPYVAGQVRAERIQQNFIKLVQQSQMVLEKLRQSGLKQISTNAFIGVMEKQLGAVCVSPQLMREFAERKLQSFSQDLRTQGYQAEVRFNKLTKEPVLFFEKMAQQVKGRS